MTRLKELRKAAGYTQDKLAKAISVSRSTVAMWETSSHAPDYQTIAKLAEIFGVSVDYILGIDTPEKKKNIVPVLGKVAAGIPIEAITDIEDYEEIDEALAATGEFFALRIKGASMEPRIKEGDVVIVRRQESAESGDTVVVLVNGDAATVKKIRYGADGISLIPSNPAYDVQFYSKADIEQLPVRIIGRVVELRGKF